MSSLWQALRAVVKGVIRTLHRSDRGAVNMDGQLVVFRTDTREVHTESPGPEHPEGYPHQLSSPLPPRSSSRSSSALPVDATSNANASRDPAPVAAPGPSYNHPRDVPQSVYPHHHRAEQTRYSGASSDRHRTQCPVCLSPRRCQEAMQRAYVGARTSSTIHDAGSREFTPRPSIIDIHLTEGETREIAPLMSLFPPADRRSSAMPSERLVSSSSSNATAYHHQHHHHHHHRARRTFSEFNVLFHRDETIWRILCNNNGALPEYDSLDPPGPPPDYRHLMEEDRRLAARRAHREVTMVRERWYEVEETVEEEEVGEWYEA